jgi:hypothetical protein
MNAIVPVTHGLVPGSMGEAMKLAEMMAGAKLVPAALQQSPADCLMVIQQAVRWQMDPFAVAQECSVIQGKLMHSGKLVAAVVNARGNLVERLSFDYAGQGEHRTITVSGKLHGESAARTVSVRLGDAKTNNKVWQTQPDQQLMYHGVRVWARRHTPELMLGVWSPEEFDEANGRREPPAPAPLELTASEPEIFDVETGEIGPRELPVEDGNWIAFGQALISAVQSAGSLEVADAWTEANAGPIERMAKEAPKVHARMAKAIEAATIRLLPTETPADAQEADPTPEEPETENAPTASNGGASGASEMGPDESEAWRKEAVAFFKGAQTEKAVQTYWRNNCEPKVDEAFPGDVSEARRARDAALARLGEK